MALSLLRVPRVVAKPPKYVVVRVVREQLRLHRIEHLLCRGMSTRPPAVLMGEALSNMKRLSSGIEPAQTRY